MTYKYHHLEEFCVFLLDERKGQRDIGFHTLDHWIAKKFGFSPYTKKIIKEALLQFKFIESTGEGDRFRITYMIDTKKEAEKEVDDELKRLGIK